MHLQQNKDGACWVSTWNFGGVYLKSNNYSWWFQPSWKIQVKMGIFPKVRGENKKHASPSRGENSWVGRLGKKTLITSAAGDPWMSTLSQLSMVSDNGMSYLFKSAGVISNKVPLVMRFPQRLGIWLPKTDSKRLWKWAKPKFWHSWIPTIDLYRGYPPGY